MRPRGGGREGCFDGEGKGAAVRTSGRLLRRRRGAGEAGEAGDGGRGHGPPESPIWTTRGAGSNLLPTIRKAKIVVVNAYRLALTEKYCKDMFLFSLGD